MRYKLYKDEKYTKRKVRIQKKRKKRLKNLLIVTALGTVVIFTANVFNVNADDKVKNDINIEVINTDEGIDFKNVNYPKEDITVTEKIEEIKDPFNVGSSPDKKMVVDFLASPEGNLIYKYASDYGVDPNIMAAIAMQETTLNHYACIPGGDMYSGYGVGLMQLESPTGEEVKAYNYNTNEWDAEYITMDNACNIDTNIKIGCMLFQNKLKENGGNVFLAIQSHNYGQGMIDMMMDHLYGDNARAVKMDYSNISWYDEIKNIHNNPGLYLEGWNESGYGDGDYLEHVLRFCPTDEVSFKMTGYQNTFNLKTMKLTDQYEYALAHKR